MLETLTANQERKINIIANRYIRELTKPPRFARRAITAWLEVAYAMYDLPVPGRVEIVDSPFAALSLASELTGTRQTDVDWCGIAVGGWVSFYDYFAEIGVLTADEFADVAKLRDFGRVAWDSVLLDECAIVIRRPKALRVDDEGNLHALKGPAIEWRDGERDYAYHGTWVPERMVRDPRGYSRAEYSAITNTEERRALSEIAGWDWVVDLVGGSVTDAWTDPATRLTYELIAAADGQRLLRKQSPKLANGKQPTYLEPVHEELKTARAARKWQATTLTPAQCEADPELRYGQET
jgi:hypothetical protein